MSQPETALQRADRLRRERSVQVQLRLTPEEAAAFDRARGELSRQAFARELILRCANRRLTFESIDIEEHY